MATLLDIVKKGSTDRSVTIRIIDSTDGTPETGVVFDTAGIDLWYRREGEAKTAITEATLAALTTAHTDGGFLHIGDGEYRLDLPDAAFATGANHVDVGGTVTGMIVIGGRVRLVAYDPEDAVRLGLTALPAAAADAAGGLPISDAGGLDLDARLDAAVTSRASQTSVDTIDGIVDSILADTGTDGVVVAAGSKTGYALTATTGLGNQTANITGNLSGSVGSVTGSVGSISGVTFPTNFSDLAITVTTGLVSVGTLAANTVTASALATDAVNELVDQVWREAIADHSGTAGSTAEQLAAAGAAGDPWATALPGSYTSGQAGKIVGDNLNATVGSRATQTSVDTVDGIVDAILDDTDLIDDATSGLAKIATDTAAILVDTAVIGAAGAGLTAIPWNAAWDAEVESEANDALVALHLDHLLATTYDPAAKPGAADALLNELIEDDGGVSRYSANALEQAPSGTGGDATAANQTTILNHLTDIKGGTFSGATDSLEAIRDRGDTAWITSTLTTGGIADAVWDEARSGHTTAGTFGFFLDAAISGVGGAVGSGADSVTLELKDGSGDPIADADVWITTDSAGANVVAGTLQTNSLGQVTFLLDAGLTYWRWAQKDGTNFTNPASFVAVAD